jgi:hypothetical protein
LTQPKAVRDSSELTLIVLFPLNMATDKPLLLSAILGSKNAITVMKFFCTDLHLDIEVQVEGDVKIGKRSQYYVQLYAADNEVTISTKLKLEPPSSVLKWEWNADNQMWVLGLVINLFRSILTSGNQLVRAVIDDEG